MEILKDFYLLDEDGNPALDSDGFNIYKDQPETKSKDDLIRIINLGKKQHVIEKFAAMYLSGLQWEWYHSYRAFLEKNRERQVLISENMYNDSFIAPDEIPEPQRPEIISVNEALNNIPEYKSLLKKRGFDYSGVNISLNESNQNGIAAVLSGLQLADSESIDMFPIKFSAESLDGLKDVSFNSLVEFKNFAMLFMAERQEFFK